MSFVRASRLLLPLSGLLMIASMVLLVVPGPRLSIEFTGGTLMEWALTPDHTQEDLQQTIDAYTAMPTIGASASYAKTSGGSVMVRTIKLENEEHTALAQYIRDSLGEEIRETQFTTIGPTVGENLKQRSLWALTIAIVAIVLYLALVFRKLPGHLSAWSFGLAAIVALAHDTLITVGIFTILSYTTSFQFDTLFVTALLSIMGYSVNDTIVIFDRIRGNMFLDGKRQDFGPLVDRSLHETVTRTLNTGAGALIMLIVLSLFAAESIRWFVLAMIVGTLIGTYSSFFVAAPLLVWWKKAGWADRR